MSTPYCRHIRTNGRRCTAFAMRNGTECYFHSSMNTRHRALNPRADATPTVIHPLNVDAGLLQREPLLAQYYGIPTGPLALDFPQLEDRESIQVSLSMVLAALGQNRLDSKRAAVMLYNLQVASSNVARLEHDHDHVVTETVRDDAGNELAPDVDPEEIVKRDQFLAELEQREQEQYERWREQLDDDDDEYDEDDGGDF